MKEKIKPYLGLFFKFFLPAYILFTILTFPTNDLRHVISAKIAQATQNRVQVQFDKIAIHLLPKPSLYLEKVQVDTLTMDSLKMDDLSIAPSILGLITFKPGVNLSSNDFFSGNLELSARQGSKTAKEVTKQVVEVQIEKLKSTEVLEFFQKNFPIQTLLNLKLNADIDPSFQEGIDGSLQASTDRISIRPFSIPGEFGAIDIPKTQISSLQLSADVKKNNIKITDAQLGKAGDTIYGSLSGDAKIKMLATPAGPKLASASYDLVLNLSIQKSFLNQLVFKPIIEGFLSPKNANESLLKLRISANRLGGPPNIQKIQ